MMQMYVEVMLVLSSISIRVHIIKSKSINVHIVTLNKHHIH